MVSTTLFILFLFLFIVAIVFGCWYYFNFFSKQIKYKEPITLVPVPYANLKTGQNKPLPKQSIDDPTDGEKFL